MDGETVITGIILEESIRIHRTYGPGLLESAYEQLLAHALMRRGLRVRRQVPVPLVDGGVRIRTAFRADLLVEEKVIVETKALSKNDPIAPSQLLTHIVLMDITVGLAINFGLSTLRKGVKRVIDTQRRFTPVPRWTFHYHPINMPSTTPPLNRSSPRPPLPPRPPR